jgi:predicted alpha/beta superfamily hydrolase
MIPTLFLLALGQLNPLPQEGQDPQPVVLATEIAFLSDVLGEKRTIRIYLPPSAPEAGPYPTLYLLDAEHNLELTVGIVRALARAQLLPEMVVVGLVNGSRREHDLSPPTRVEADRRRYGAGGADAFLEFLAAEVEPLVAERVKISNVRVLVGHSIGGLFALHALIQAPEHFYGMVVISPSLFWDEQSTPGKLAGLLADSAGLEEVFLFLSLANETSPGFQEAVAVLEENQTAWLHWKARTFPEEDHLSTVVESTYHGLRHVFRNWNQKPLLDALDTEGLAQRLDQLSRRFGFEVLPWEWELAETGRAAIRTGDFDAGVALLELGAERRPTSLVLHNYLGEALQEAGHLERARSVYERSRAIAKERGSPMIRWIDERLSELDG